MIFVNGRPVPTPYDYEDVEKPNPYSEQTGPGFVRVTAWVPADFIVSGNPVVLFKVPFCGPEWVARTVVTADIPKVEWLGGDQQQTITITASFDFLDDDDWTLRLDRDYVLGSAEFQSLDSRRLQLTLPAHVLRSYTKLVLRSRKANVGYLLEIPAQSEGSLSAAALDNGEGAPIVAKGEPAVVHWEGKALDTVTKVQAGAQELLFESYSQGQRLRVFLGAAQTAVEGKLDLAFMTKMGAMLQAAVFVLEQTPTIS